MSKQNFCIVCKKPAKNIVLYGEIQDMRVAFCREHIKDCLSCNRCTIEEI